MPSASRSHRSRSASGSRRSSSTRSTSSSSARRRSLAEREAASALALMRELGQNRRMINLAHVASVRLPAVRRRRLMRLTTGRIGKRSARR